MFPYGIAILSMKKAKSPKLLVGSGHAVCSVLSGVPVVVVRRGSINEELEVRGGSSIPRGSAEPLSGVVKAGEEPSSTGALLPTLATGTDGSVSRVVAGVTRLSEV